MLEKMTKPLSCTELTMTWEACPSQWEGVLSDGRHLYCRYRWGSLTIGMGATHIDAVQNAIFHFLVLGADFDGTMSTEELSPHLEAFLAELEEAKRERHPSV